MHFDARLHLVALMPLVFFLLVHFGSSQCMCGRLDVDLPFGPHADPIEPGPILSVTATAVTLDGLRVAASTDGVTDYSRLREHLREIRTLLPDNRAPVDTIIFAVDRGVLWSHLAPLVRIAAYEGFSRQQFAATTPARLGLPD